MGMRTPTFDSRFFTGNRKRLAANLADAGLIVIPANVQLQKNADEGYPFRQDSSFWYLTGLDVADAMLVINVREGTEYLVLPHRDAHRDQWETGHDVATFSASSGIEQIIPFRQGMRRLKADVQKAQTLHTLLPPPKRFITFYGLYPNPARTILVQRLKRMNRDLRFVSARDAIKDLRIIKQKPEIEAIKAAIAVTEEGLRKLQPLIATSPYEYEARAELHAVFTRQGAAIGFDTVIAAGANAALIHYEKSSKRLLGDEILLVDAGAAVSYYNADITRVYRPVQGMGQRQQEVFDALERLWNYAVGLIKPGLSHREYENLVRERMGQELVGLGLLKRPTKTGIRHYFPHLTSHHLGLDVHDLANHDEAFQENMVLTVEPGIYIPEEGIGLRIEDDVIVTKDGCDILSGGLPHLI